MVAINPSNHRFSYLNSFHPMSFWIGRINRESAYSAAEKPAPNHDLHHENGYLQFSAFRINPSLIKYDFPWSWCKKWRHNGIVWTSFMFFTNQTSSIIIPLVAPWGPNLDPCGKIVILTGARKIHIKVVCVFLPIRHFQFSFLWLSLDVPTWILVARMWSRQVRAKFTSKSFMFFYPSDISHFHSFGCPLLPQFGSLQQKCAPDRCAQNSHKSRLCFLPIRHFSFSFLLLSLGIPIWILAAKVCSWQARAKST